MVKLKFENGIEQKIQGQTIGKTMAKPVGVVKNQEKPRILNPVHRKHRSESVCKTDSFD